MAEASGDHTWGRGQAGRGALWGGGGVRLFRIGLAASHHHLSATGLAAPGGDLSGARAYAAPALGLALAPLGARPPCPGRSWSFAPWPPWAPATLSWAELLPCSLAPCSII